MTQQEFFNRYTYSVKADRIGGGGFGTVYRATDKLLHRKVAIKVSEVKIVGDKEFSLKTEFDAVGKLPPHQNIAHYEELYSFESPQGVFDYAVMQYYEDGNLKNLIDKGCLTFEQKEKIAEGILDGIAFLHGNKVVHRDLKPANILICREGGDYVPLITDFGLSKGVEEMSKSGFTNSVAGGSPGYMSPEQIKGGIMQLNTDLWSYGVIVYELFSGRRLFQSASQSGGTTEVNDMILHKDISAEIASLPGKWRMVAERCLVRDNRLRAKSAGELRAIIGTGDGPETKIGFQEEPEITLVEEPEPRPKPKPQPEPKPQPKPKRNLAWLWVLLAVAVLGGVALGVKSNMERKRLAEQQRLAEERQAAADNEFFQNCKDVSDYRSYLNKYPKGLNVELARNKISQHVADSTKKAKAEAKAQEAKRQRQVAEENERKIREATNGHEYVDFGLPSGTLWATCNVGASSPEGYGSYFAWGETNPKKCYNLNNLKYYLEGRRESDNVKYLKYVTDSHYGSVDNRTTLDLSDDAARANWGGRWRMPTDAEFRELVDKCTWTWTTMCGKKGYKVTSKSNGNSIFFPAAGYRRDENLNKADSEGFYWSNSVYEPVSNYERSLDFSSTLHCTYFSCREDGLPVRPVCSSHN